MSKKKILVSGGAGFIGSHLVDELLQCGHTVVALDNLRNGNLRNLAQAKANVNFKFFQGDILNPADCLASLDDIDIVYHLACLGVRHSLSYPFENHRVNAEGSLNFLAASREKGIKRFFYISTSEVYGKTVEFPIREESPTRPTTVYGASKLAGEHYALAFEECFGLQTTVLRIFNNYGPRAHHEGDSGEVIPRTIVSALYDQAPVIFGDGSITRDFFFVRDTARALSGLVDRDDLVGATINIGTGQEITMKELMLKLLRLMGKEKLGINFHPSRPADVPRLWVDPSKFQRLTGFKSSISMDEGLQETIEYYRNLSSGENLVNAVPLINWERASK